MTNATGFESVAVTYNGAIPMTVTPGIADDHKTTTVTSSVTSIPAASDTDDPYTFKADTNDPKTKVDVATLKYTTNGVITITPMRTYKTVKVLTFVVRMGDNLKPVVEKSNYSIAFKNSSSSTFVLFHYCEGGGKPHTTACPSQELAPKGETCFAWDTTAGKINEDTTCGHVYYCLTGSPESNPPPRVLGVQLTGYTPTGGPPKTRFQYSSGVNLYGDNSDVAPPFWIDEGKSWRESYSFIIPAGSRPGNIKITVEPILLDGSYYSVMVVIEDSE
ncbi:hypothetical protein B0H16DRAFT_1848193 [Mycena metata]|uniref:Uncharacterized protein n=1 Tax=Mycena metata TaxID=1033252 RepID=A0AAD7IU98_9AGAR|nr:hypothetical protein B0H16DRAFT_1848193 [Mycena metata]